MAGLDPAIHEAAPRLNRTNIIRRASSWIAGTSPAMTNERVEFDGSRVGML
jgi:hypothetical protein